MKDLYEYLKYYGNSTFEEIAFNDVDSLIITELTYVKLKVFFTNQKCQTLKELCTEFLNKYSKKDFKKEDYLFPSSYKLMVALKDCQRFNQAKIYNYNEQTNEETQFGALTLRFPNNLCYVAFEGTDSSIIGWQEDFSLIYKFPTQSQTLSKEYLNKTITIFDRNIYIGGHSKGGNLAMYAYMYAKPTIKKRIKQVYNFDGPGFLDNIISSKEYQEMSQKLKMFVPEQSIFGMILGHQQYQVVKSHSLGILQHYGDSWCCFGGKFLEGKLSKKSNKLEENLKNYLNKMTEEEKIKFVETLIIVCKNLKIKNVMQFRDIKISSIINFLKEFKDIPNSTKKIFFDVIKMILVG